MVPALAELRSTPLSVAEVLAAVAHPAAGGQSVFVGTVRDHDEDRAVVSLDYSAHPTADEVIRAIAERIAAEPAVLGLAVVHRVGSLVIGDDAIVAAVATAHRGEAFERLPPPCRHREARAAGLEAAALLRRLQRVGRLVLSDRSRGPGLLPLGRDRSAVARRAHRGHHRGVAAGCPLSPPGAPADDRRVHRGARALPSGDGARAAAPAPASAAEGVTAR